MKKLFLFVAVAAMAFSCSSDDDNGGGSSSDKVMFKLNGESKTLTNVVVNEATEDGETYLNVTATLGGTDEILTFSTMRGDVGSDMAYMWMYTKNGNDYYDDGAFSSVIQTNSNDRLKGSFAGTLSYWDNETETEVTAVFTDGSFDIKY